VVRSCLRTVWPIRPPVIFCQRKTCSWCHR